MVRKHQPRSGLSFILCPSAAENIDCLLVSSRYWREGIGVVPMICGSSRKPRVPRCLLLDKEPVSAPPGFVVTRRERAESWLVPELNFPAPSLHLSLQPSAKSPSSYSKCWCRRVSSPGNKGCTCQAWFLSAGLLAQKEMEQVL